MTPSLPATGDARRAAAQAAKGPVVNALAGMTLRRFRTSRIPSNACCWVAFDHDRRQHAGHDAAVDARRENGGRPRSLVADPDVVAARDAVENPGGQLQTGHPRRLGDESLDARRGTARSGRGTTGQSTATARRCWSSITAAGRSSVTSTRTTTCAAQICREGGAARVVGRLSAGARAQGARRIRGRVRRVSVGAATTRPSWAPTRGGWPWAATAQAATWPRWCRCGPATRRHRCRRCSCCCIRSPTTTARPGRRRCSPRASSSPSRDMDWFSAQFLDGARGRRGRPAGVAAAGRRPVRAAARAGAHRRVRPAARRGQAVRRRHAGRRAWPSTTGSTVRSCTGSPTSSRWAVPARPRPRNRSRRCAPIWPAPAKPRQATPVLLTRGHQTQEERALRPEGSRPQAQPGDPDRPDRRSW